MKDPIKKLIETHVNFRASFVEVPAAFTRSFMRKGKSYTYLGMELTKNEHLEKTVEKIRNLTTAST